MIGDRLYVALPPRLTATRLEARSHTYKLASWQMTGIVNIRPSTSGQSRRTRLRHACPHAVFDARVARQIQNRLAVLLEGLPGQDLSEKVRRVVFGAFCLHAPQ